MRYAKPTKNLQQKYHQKSIIKTTAHARAHGFTLVETLVVIVAIAILATICIVAYTGIQQRARESRVALQLTQLRKKMEMYRIEKGEWPFQTRLDEVLAEDGPGWVASAWCNSARGYIERNLADSGALGFEGWSSSCWTLSSYQGGKFVGYKACAGVIVAHTSFGSTDRKTFYISSERLGVSPPIGDGDETTARQWCFDES